MRVSAVIVGILLSFAGASASSASEAASAARAQIQGIFGAVRSGKFKTAGCSRVSGEKWVAFLLLGTPIRHTYQFGKGCDVQGAVEIKRDPFPVDVAVRNLGEAKRLKGTVVPDFDGSFKTKQIRIDVKMPDSKLEKDKKAEYMKFDAEYKMVMGFDGRPKENSGGEVRVKSYAGKPVDIVERLDVK